MTKLVKELHCAMKQCKHGTIMRLASIDWQVRGKHLTSRKGRLVHCRGEVDLRIIMGGMFWAGLVIILVDMLV